MEISSHSPIFKSQSLVPHLNLSRSRSEMGRGKIEIKHIENSMLPSPSAATGSSRRPRRSACSANPRSPSLSSPASKVTDVRNYKNLSAEIDRIKKENGNMQIELRHLKGEDLNSLNPRELIPIEKILQNGVTRAYVLSRCSS